VHAGVPMLPLAFAIVVALLVLAHAVAWRRRRSARRLAAAVERIADGAVPGVALDVGDAELQPLVRAVRRLCAARDQREHALRLDRDERERILAHMSDGVALIDGGGRVRHLNPRAVELLGLARPAPVGAALSEVARMPGLLERVERCRATRHVEDGRMTVPGPPERTLRVTVTPLGADPDGGVVVVLQDQSELERVDHIRRDFVANVSHELRTPLTSLRGYAETLLAGGLEDPEHRERFVQVIREQSMRLQAMTEDLLTLAEIERPDAAVRAEPFDLRGLARGVVETFRDAAVRRALHVVPPDGVPVPIVADRARIEQAVSNLVDNAIKYTDRGHVAVRVGADPVRAWVEVEDSGTGIPAEDLERVFERFYRVDKARSRERGGTGLGLAIVRHVAELHGGRASVTSVVGGGSTFRLELPRAAA